MRSLCLGEWLAGRLAQAGAEGVWGSLCRDGARGIPGPPRVGLLVPSPRDSTLTPNMGALVSAIERHLPSWLLDVWSLDIVDERMSEQERVSHAPDQDSVHPKPDKAVVLNKR